MDISIIYMHTHPLSLVVAHLQPLFIHISPLINPLFSPFNSFLIRTKKIEIEINRNRNRKYTYINI